MEYDTYINLNNFVYKIIFSNSMVKCKIFTEFFLKMSQKHR